jgi:hypothetical protein
MSEEQAAVLRGIKAVSDALDSMLATMQELDRREPRVTATMRKYGVIQSISAVGDAFSHACTDIGALFKSLGMDN